MAIYLNHLSTSEDIVRLHNSLHKIVLKLHKSSSSIGFILKCLFKKVTPKFAKVKGQFLRKANIWEGEKAILKSHLSSHYQDLHEQCNLLQNQCSWLTNKTSAIYTKFVLNRIRINQRHFRTESFHTKNEKLKRMLPKEPTSSYKVPVVNLSNTILKNRELQQLQYGLDHCFVDKNENTKRNLATSLETVAERVTPIVEDSEKENFHQFLRKYTDIFSNNIYRAHDYTYYNLKRLSKDPETVILSGDKDSCVVIMNKNDYINKVQDMINK